MTLFRKYEGWLVLAGAFLLCSVLGSVHAFSIFLVPLETQFGAGRSAISLIYSGALICVTLAVLLGHRVYGRVPAATLVLMSGLLGAFGALIAGYAPSLPFVWLGYCVFFGLANGLGYGFGLQIAAQVNPGREGLAMGFVTAAYASGAALSPALFELALSIGGFQVAMTGLALCLLATGCLSTVAMQVAQSTYLEDRQPGEDPERKPHSAKPIALLWSTYFGGVMAGLMVMGHAAGIASDSPGAQNIWLAPAVLALCNLAGSLMGGRLADRYPARLILTRLSVLTVLGLVGLATGPTFAGVLVCLSVIGLAYGGTIAAHPAYIFKSFEKEGSARIYGQIFTAWGAARLAGPSLAGWLYDVSGAYAAAALIAACFGLVSIGTTLVFFRRA